MFSIWYFAAAWLYKRHTAAAALIGILFLQTLDIDEELNLTTERGSTRNASPSCCFHCGQMAIERDADGVNAPHQNMYTVCNFNRYPVRGLFKIERHSPAQIRLQHHAAFVTNENELHTPHPTWLCSAYSAIQQSQSATGTGWGTEMQPNGPDYFMEGISGCCWGS